MTDDDRLIYQQLSEDWRHRDRMTWQLPSVLIIVGGLLLALIFNVESPVESSVKDYLLWGGFVFTLLLTFFLTRNTYLQAVGADLMERIREGGNEADVARRGARRIPWRRKNYSFSDMRGDFLKPLSAIFQLVVCSLIAGLLVFLVKNGSCVWWFFSGMAASFATVVFVICYSYLKFKVP